MITIPPISFLKDRINVYEIALIEAKRRYEEEPNNSEKQQIFRYMGTLERQLTDWQHQLKIQEEALKDENKGRRRNLKDK